MWMPHRLRGWRRLLLAALTVPSLSAAAADAPCIRVGPLGVPAAEVATRLAALPDYQRLALASEAADLPRRFVDTVLVPELLLAAEARRRGLERSPAAADTLREVLRAALVEELRRELARRAPVTDAEIERYYADHRERFGRPERIRLWRILVDDRAAAEDILRRVRGVDGVARWSELARDRSRDQATALRKGELGFVYPDGRTEVPTLRVDPALYAAAAQVKDGELVEVPVAEGPRLGVVWRRGTLPAVEEPLAEVRPLIRDALEREALERELRRLVGELRARSVKAGDPAALAELASLPITEARALPPPVLSALAPANSAPPRPTDRGLR